MGGAQQSVFLTSPPEDFDAHASLRTTALRSQSRGWLGERERGEREKNGNVRLDSFMEEQREESSVVDFK